MMPVEYDLAIVVLDGGELIIQFDGRPQRRLLPVAADYFLVQDRDDLRLRFFREGNQVTAMERIYSDGWRGLTSRT